MKHNQNNIFEKDVLDYLELKYANACVREVVVYGGEEIDFFTWYYGHTALFVISDDRDVIMADVAKRKKQSPSESVGEEKFYVCPLGTILPHELPSGWGLIVFDAEQPFMSETLVRSDLMSCDLRKEKSIFMNYLSKQQNGIK